MNSKITQARIEDKLYTKRCAIQEKLKSSSSREMSRLELLEFDRFLVNEMDKLRIEQQETLERVNFPRFV